MDSAYDLQSVPENVRLAVISEFTRENGKLGAAALTPKIRAEQARKGWENRRRKWPQTSGYRATRRLQTETTAQHS